MINPHLVFNSVDSAPECRAGGSVHIQHVSIVFYSLTVDIKIHTSTKLLISNLTPESFSPAAVGRNSTGLLRNFRLHFLIEAFCEALSSLVK